MNGDPIDVAVRNIAETKCLLENLITSSESFDYPKAKVALKQLQRKVRELAKLQAALEKRHATAVRPNVQVVDFRNAGLTDTARL